MVGRRARHNVGAWESAQEIDNFGTECRGFGMAKAGISAEIPVTFHPAHEVHAPRAAKITA